MRLDCDLDGFRIAPGDSVDLAARPTAIAPLYRSKADYEGLLAAYRDEISALQEKLYADARHALLVIFQGLDTAGKGGAIKHVMSGINPQGCQVHAFGEPSAEELAHDFLWRTWKRLPERGRIGIFDRSYYEEVLVVRVFPKLLRPQRLPAKRVDMARIWDERHRAIVDMERHLHRAGTTVVKLFLHLSKEEQRRRLLARIDAPEKNWKMSPADLVGRERWDAFREAYQDCMAATSTAEAPWYSVPADDKRNARLIVSRIILDAMAGLDLRFPQASRSHRAALARARRILEDEGC